MKRQKQRQCNNNGVILLIWFLENVLYPFNPLWKLFPELSHDGNYTIILSISSLTGTVIKISLSLHQVTRVRIPSGSGIFQLCAWMPGVTPLGVEWAATWIDSTTGSDEWRHYEEALNKLGKILSNFQSRNVVLSMLYQLFICLLVSLIIY